MSHPRLQRGLSLVELMVAMAISLALMAALVTLVVNNGRAGTELERSSRQIENGRYAIELLADEIRLAGYLGELAPVGAVSGTPDPCETDPAAMGFVAAPLTVPTPIEGFDGATPPGCIADHRPDTASLALRRVSTDVFPAAAVDAGDPHLQTSRCVSDPPGTRLIFSDDAAALTLRNRDCTAVNAVRRYVSRIYFVSSCSDCGRDTIPTLKRIELIDGAMRETPLAEGIEELQFEYGFDTDGDGEPDQFRTAPDGVAGSPANDWANVMAVRIHLISRTTEETPGYTDPKSYTLGLHGTRGPFADGFKRRAYSALVRLNNPAGLRE